MKVKLFTDGATARAGEINNFTSVDQLCEMSEHPEFHLMADENSGAALAEQVLEE